MHPSQYQAGDVAARDEQNQKYGRHKDEQCAARGAGDFDVEWTDHRGPALEVRWVQLVETSGDGADLGLRVRYRYTRLQEPDGVTLAIVPRRFLFRGQCQRRPNGGDLARGFEALGAVREREARGHDSDDAIRLRVEQQFLAEDARIGAELRLPK